MNRKNNSLLEIVKIHQNYHTMKLKKMDVRFSKLTYITLILDPYHYLPRKIGF